MSNRQLAFGFAKKLKKFSRLKRALKAKKSISSKDHVAVRQYINVLTRFRKLQKQLSGLQTQFKVAAAGVTFAAFMGSTENAIAQTTHIGGFRETDRALNPVHPPISGYALSPTPVDYDNDGDYDIVIGDEDGKITLLKNEGTKTNPRFLEIEIEPVYIDGYGEEVTTYFPNYAAPALADVDGDGDLDLFVGSNVSSPDRIFYYLNEGGKFIDKTNDVWDPVAKTGNPLHDIASGYKATPGFIDFDHDGDLDLFIGHNYDSYYRTAIDYYEFNSITGQFEKDVDFKVSAFNADNVAPTFADLDHDGDFDMLVGSSYSDILYFQNVGGVFVEQEDNAWVADTDPDTPGQQTYGNPFYRISPGYDTVPVFVDLDGDSDLDVVIGYGFDSDWTLQYYVNDGHEGFTQTEGLDNPFNSIDSRSSVSPLLQFVNDDPYIDLVFSPGQSYYDDESETSGYRLTYYQGQADGSFTKVKDEDNPFYAEYLEGDNFIILDFDGDQELDLISGNENGWLEYFKKGENGYVRQDPDDPSNPFYDINVGSESFPNLVDIDADGDLDLIIGNKYGDVSFYENLKIDQSAATGSNSFVQREDEENPFDNVKPLIDPYYMRGWNRANIRLADMDGDGDLDAFLGISSVQPTNDGDEDPTEPGVLYYENTGTAQDPHFTINFLNSPFAELEVNDNPVLSFGDIDRDGDVDILVGGDNAGFQYFVNDNPAPTITTLQTLSYTSGSGAISVDPNLTLADADNDLITKVVITITGYVAGKDILSITPQFGITGSQDNVTGTLTLTGRNTVTEFQTVLRSMTYNFTGTTPSGRESTAEGRTTTSTKDLSLMVFDTDGTVLPSTTPKILTITFPNSKPVLAGTPPATSINPNVAVVLAAGITAIDGDDATLEGASVVISSGFVAAEDQLIFANQNGISGTYTASTGVLTLSGTSSVANYQAALRSVKYQSSAAPTAVSKTIIFSITDGENVSNTIPVTLTLNTNQPPAIAAKVVATQVLSTVTVDLTALVSDPNNNVDISTLKIIQQPISGATATLDASARLTIDYSNTKFAGTDRLRVEVCDALGACAQQDITVEVEGDVQVYNGMSPNGDGLNDFFLIQNIELLEPANTVAIFNRWGDKIFEVENYDNASRRFDGRGDGGKEITSGIYFYKVSFSSGKEPLSGYLTVKR